MKEKFYRTIKLIGEESFEKLQKSKILLVGVGGVGGYVAEGLIRAGIGELTIVDKDVVAESNINRQIIALTNTVGRDKVEVAKERLLLINPDAKLTTLKQFITPDNIKELHIENYDYIVDAIDFVPAKLSLIESAKSHNINIISCMGTGNKIHPEKLEIADISKTSDCPLAKKIRQELSKRGIKGVKVLYSKENPIKTEIIEDGKRVPASISTVPPVAGLLIANEVILDLIKK